MMNLMLAFLLQHFRLLGTYKFNSNILYNECVISYTLYKHCIPRVLKQKLFDALLNLNFFLNQALRRRILMGE